jgi:hypothetical protein
VLSQPTTNETDSQYFSKELKLDLNGTHLGKMHTKKLHHVVETFTFKAHTKWMDHAPSWQTQIA